MPLTWPRRTGAGAAESDGQVGGDNVVSAIPGVLIDYASWAQGLDIDLERRAHSLYNAIDVLQASAPDPKYLTIGPSDYVSNLAFNHALRDQQTDQWVGQVGQAFLRIETRGLPPGLVRGNYQDFLNGLVTTSQAVLVGLVGGDPTIPLPPLPADPHQRKAWWQTLTPDEQMAYLRYNAADVAYLATEDQLHQAGFKNLHDVYLQQSFIDAGIDPSTWDPSKGLKANDATVQAVYAYYQHLWDQNHNLQWAGMAKLAGATVYGGLMDMYTLSQMERDGWEHAGGDILGGLAGAGIGFLVGGPVGAIIGGIGGIGAHEGGLALTTHEANYFQDQFLAMQKAIFMDMGWQHAAYMHGGMDAIDALHVEDGSNSPNGMDNATWKAWQQINSGDPAQVAKGNEALLHREQFTVVQPLYDQLHQRPDGGLFSLFVSHVTKSPIPGGKPFSDFPGDVTNFNDRWNWIEQDMLPKYQQLLQNPLQAQQLIDESLRQRGDQFRVLPLHVDGY